MVKAPQTSPISVCTSSSGVLALQDQLVLCCSGRPTDLCEFPGSAEPVASELWHEDFVGTVYDTLVAVAKCQPGMMSLCITPMVLY
jgi:hypothetical protein